MKKFAFIDVQNTETTTLKVLKFVIDHEKLFSFSRLSTKLRNLTKESGSPVRFIELDNLKFRINKVV